MTPLLLYVPPLLGTGNLDMRAVTGLTIVQALFATSFGALGHRRYKRLHKRLAIEMGIVVFIFSLLGGVGSKGISNQALMGVFASLALVAAGLMFIPLKEEVQEASVEEVTYNRLLAFAVASTIGFLGGLVGQGGAFMLVPSLLFILKIPLRITLGTTLAIGWCSSLAGSIGKLTTGQIPLFLALFLVLGIIPGTQVGSMLSQRVKASSLKYLLATLISLVAIKMWYEILFKW